MNLPVNGQVEPPDRQLHQSSFLGGCKNDALPVNEVNLPIEGVYVNARQFTHPSQRDFVHQKPEYLFVFVDKPLPGSRVAAH